MKLAWMLACALVASPAWATDPGVDSGVGSYRHGDYAGAVSALKSSLDKGIADPGERTRARLYLASSYEAEGQLDPARQVLKEMFQADRAIPIDPALFPPSFVKLAEDVRHQLPPPSAPQQTAAAPAPEEPLSAWKSKHTSAARELCGWARWHRKSARAFYAFDARHPRELWTFAGWAIYHPRLKLEEFLAAHKDWAGFKQLVGKNRMATYAFMRWARRNPVAADKLTKHTGGLAWAGNHLGC